MAYGRRINLDARPHLRRPRQDGSVWLTALLALGAIGLVVMLLLPATRTARPAARRAQCSNNLKQISLALQTYHDQYHSLPPAYTVDATGKPLHSWRTLILPFLQPTLYESIDLTKPWDDPANAAALESNVAAYQCPGTDLPPNHTTYFACVTPDGLFCGTAENSPSASAIESDQARMMMLVEVSQDQAIPWMQPRDADEAMILSLGKESKLAHPAIHAALGDGSVRSIPVDTSADDRLKLLAGQKSFD